MSTLLNRNAMIPAKRVTNRGKSATDSAPGSAELCRQVGVMKRQTRGRLLVLTGSLALHASGDAGEVDRRLGRNLAGR
jgi:hypothetical protein